MCWAGKEHDPLLRGQIVCAQDSDAGIHLVFLVGRWIYGNPGLGDDKYHRNTQHFQMISLKPTEAHRMVEKHIHYNLAADSRF